MEGFKISNEEYEKRRIVLSDDLPKAQTAAAASTRMFPSPAHETLRYRQL